MPSLTHGKIRKCWGNCFAVSPFDFVLKIEVMTQILGSIELVKSQMIEAVNDRAHGMITIACELVGISRAVHYKWAEADKVYAERIEEAKANPRHNEELVELAIAGLIKNLKGGNPKAVQDVLSNFNTAGYSNSKKGAEEASQVFIGFGLDFEEED